MKRKQIKVGLLALAVATLVTAGAAGLLARPGRDPDIRHRAALGDVVWNHELHARMKGVTCQACHHTTRPGVTNPEPCNNCHREPARDRQGRVMTDIYPDLIAADNSAPAPKPSPRFRGPAAMEAFHAKCLGCHQAMKQGPVSCRDCHAQRFSGPHGRVEWDHRSHSRQLGIECVFCHHTSKGTGQSDVPGCRQCHHGEVVSRADMSTGIPGHESATHDGCGLCHAEGSPAAEAPDCTSCHRRMNSAAGPAPIEQAIHRKCFSCHNEKIRGRSPRTSVPGYCSDCHQPDPAFIRTGNGVVLWTHEAHGQEYSCQRCHHDRTGADGEPFLACQVCHHDRPGGVQVQTEMQMNPAADASHRLCLDCHREKKAGPVDCVSCHAQNPELSVFRKESDLGVVMWDHRFHAVGLEFACQECHHNMKVRGGILYTVCRGPECPEGAGNPISCANCHPNPNAPAPVPPLLVPAASARSDAVHATCVGCHQKLAGPTECAGCHLQPGNAEGGQQ